MKRIFSLIVLLFALAACATTADETEQAPVPTETAQTNLPNPASAYCEEQGYRSEIRTADDGSQWGVCIFPDGSECDEWAYYRGECGPAGTPTAETAPAGGSPTEIPTAVPIDPAGYAGWWTYTHAAYGFSILLPEDWDVEEVTGSDMLSGHALTLRPGEGTASIRMTFRRVGEEVLLWPTGVGQGEFIPHGVLEIAGEPAMRLLLICPTGEVTSIWYHGAEGQANIVRGDLEFGFIYSAGPHCEAGQSLGGKVQWAGEMIIASLTLQTP